MKLIEALRIVNAPGVAGEPPLRVGLACGIEPLHLKTYLAAHLRLASPATPVEVLTGRFDDLVGNLGLADATGLDVMAAVVEWSDIDPRLGMRRLGGWRVDDLEDVVTAAGLGLERIGAALADAAQAMPVAVVLPTLPLPPLFPQRPEESGAQELALRGGVAALARELAGHGRIRLCSPQHLDRVSPAEGRRDLEAELSTGFPYSLDHASAVAAALAALIRPPAARKGVITDLDGALWSGSVGEVGPAGVSWSLDEHAHRHALYQQMLASLASGGVLIGIASRNDPSPVGEALRRPDLLVSAGSLFPVEVHWGPKSESVRRILAAWNLAPDAVVMVDDSPLDLAEVQAAFPEMTALRFPDGDDGMWELLSALRGLFGKDRAVAEDRLRVPSLRRAAAFRAGARAHAGAEFLATVAGTVVFTDGDADLVRAVDLFQKTNQFNLNGRRLSEPALRRAITREGADLVTVAYQDRYGPLGTIAALLARRQGSRLEIAAWVISCRAFARRIEHHCLQWCFQRYAVDEILVAYRPTERNRPVLELLTSLLGEVAGEGALITRDAFDARVPPLVHRMVASDAPAQPEGGRVAR